MGRDVPAGLAAAPGEEDAHAPIKPPRPTMPCLRRDKHVAIPGRLPRSAVISADRASRGDAALLAADSGLVCGHARRASTTSLGAQSTLVVPAGEALLVVRVTSRKGLK